MLQQEIPPRSPVRFALWCSRPSRHWAFLAFFCVFVGAIGGRVLIYLIGQIADVAHLVSSGEADINTLWFWALAYPSVYFFIEIFWRGSGFFGMKWMTDVEQVVYDRLYKYLTGHSASYFNDRFAGSLTNKISNAASGLENLMAKSLWQFFSLSIAIIGDIYLTYTAHPYFTVVFVLWLMAFLATSLFLVSRIKDLAYTRAKAASELKGKIVDSTNNIDTVQQSGEVKFEHRYVGKFINKQKLTHVKEWLAHQWIFVFNGLAIAVFFFLMMAMGISLYNRELISVGNLVVIISLMSALEFRLFFLGRDIAESMASYGQIEEGLEELLLPHDITSTPDAQDLKTCGGKIEFKDVEFSYSELGIFKNLSLVITPGQRIGLVGPSGAGKSTFVNLILRQHDVLSGEILIDDQNINEVDIHSLRREIAFVPQTTSLFHRTILENIRYGKLEATEDEVLEASKLAQADVFIQTLPSQYKTYVGERGVKLSGGQRQRISIARAILKDAPILVLDEATSSLDSESEGAIQGALEKVMEGRTVIAIAHRLSTLRSMDRILVLDEGVIVEDGTHQELLEIKGLYAKLWNSQVGGFIQGDLS